MEHLHPAMAEPAGVHLVLDTERSSATEIVEAIRAARPDQLAAPGP
jgi:hypothetical protein